MVEYEIEGQENGSIRKVKLSKNRSGEIVLELQDSDGTWMNIVRLGINGKLERFSYISKQTGLDLDDKKRINVVDTDD